MRVFLSYGYRPHSTAVYFEAALGKDHEVIYIGPPYRERAGYSPNEDVCALCEILGSPSLFLFVEPGMNFFPRGLEKLKCPTACYLIDVHSDISVRERYAPFFDYLFVAQKDYVQHFKNLGYENVSWLPLACDPAVHGEIAAERVYEVGFVGNLIGPQHRRNRLVHEVALRYSCNDVSKFYPKEEIAEIYSRSKIVVNVPVNGDLNMRVFETMAAGALLVTEAIGNGQRDFFRDGVNLVEYRSERELFEKIDFYLQHEDERERIAKAGQALALERHTYGVRTRTILDTVFKNGGGGNTAGIRRMSRRERHVRYAAVYTMLRQVDSVLGEISDAVSTGAASARLWYELIKCLLRALNALIPLTPNARKARRNARC